MDGMMPFDKLRRGQEAMPLLVRFQLTATLTAGGSANAKFVTYAQQQAGLKALTGTQFKVYSAIGGFTGKSGDQGWALFWSDANRF